MPPKNLSGLVLAIKTYTLMCYMNANQPQGCSKKR